MMYYKIALITSLEDKYINHSLLVEDYYIMAGKLYYSIKRPDYDYIILSSCYYLKVSMIFK